MKKIIFVLFISSFLLVSCLNDNTSKNKEYNTTRSGTSANTDNEWKVDVNTNWINIWTGSSWTYVNGTWIVDTETDETMKEIDNIIDDISKE